MKRTVHVFLGMVLLLSSPLVAQESGQYFLTADSLKKDGWRWSIAISFENRFFLRGQWKYHPGDSGIWANPEFDDDAWDTIANTHGASPTLRHPSPVLDSLGHLVPVLDSLPPDRWEGLGWFRFHLSVDSTLAKTPLALHVYIVGAAAEVYLDGKLQCALGKVGASREEERGYGATAGEIHRPTPILFDKNNPHVIAVRYSSFATQDTPYESPFFAIALGDLKRSIDQSIEQTRYAKTFQVLMTAVPLTFAVLHLLLFAFYFRLKENLYFALFAGSLAAIAFSLYQFIYDFVTDSEQEFFILKFGSLAFFLMFPFGLRFLYSLFYAKTSKLFWLLPLILSGLAVLWGQNLFNGIFPLIALGLLALTLLEMLRVVIVALVKKKKGAWIVGMGFLALIVTFVIMLVGGSTARGREAVEIFWIIGVLGLLLSMSIYLARNIAGTSKNLEAEMKKSLQLEVENARHEVELQRAAELKAAYHELDAAHTNLKATQQQLVTQEKLASLGQLTAGIAHEIKNPLNFVNNFAALSIDLAKELREEVAKIEDGELKIDDGGSRNVDRERLAKIEDGGSKIVDGERLASIKEILETLEQNAEKINHHGKRADNIVKSMMQHARGSSGQRELADINHLLDEAVNLTYHGMRANDASFNITIEKEYDESISKLEVVPQDISRVFLNIINNACYAANQKKKDNFDGFSPMLSVTTKNLGEKIEVRIRDNGNGIPLDKREKIFNPFFTTKPTGQGTGLGLSISHDIIVQQHRGEIAVETEEGKFTEFVVRLPKV